MLGSYLLYRFIRFLLTIMSISNSGFTSSTHLDLEVGGWVDGKWVDGKWVGR